MPDEKKRWWELKGWNEQQKLKAEQLASGPAITSNTKLSWYNPICKHEHCSYDILTCPQCIEYTKQKNEEHANNKSISST